MVPGSKLYHSVGWCVGGVAKERHVERVVIPEEGGVMQPPLASDGLCVAAKLGPPKTIICASKDTEKKFLSFLSEFSKFQISCVSPKRQSAHQKR